MAAKRILSVLLSVLLILSIAQFPVMASTEGMWRSLYYTIENGVVAITGYEYSESSVDIPSMIKDCPVTSIKSGAFQYSESLKSITIPASVKSIGPRAFSGCISLKSITIPSGVSSIEDGTFYNCKALENIIIPNGVQKIGDNAFASCESLANISIPNDVISIGDVAFYNCSSLASITIPNTLTSVGYSAFNGCSDLVDVYYNGTKAQKDAIFIDVNNTYLSNATWHYFDGVCDATCSECDVTREVPDHIYDDDADATCNKCGAEREIISYISGDGKVNNKDMGILRQHLNNWGVELE